MRRILRRTVLRRVAVAALALPVAVGLMATSGYAAKPVQTATGCYEILSVEPPPMPAPPPTSGGCDVGIRLDEAARHDVAVTVRTVEGTARAGVDFVAVDEILVIRAGEVAADIRLEIVPDDIEERAERFTVVFEVLDADLAEQLAVEVTILDGDGGARSR